MNGNGTASHRHVRELLGYRVRAILELEDGSKFEGVSFGATRGISGECVFQTGMVGYPESLTDPSYSGQILVLTYPLIGNYGVPSSERDEFGILRNFESEKIQIAALLVQNYCDIPSHWASIKTLGEWLQQNNVPGLYGLDTRALTKKIREKGCMLGRIIFPEEEDHPVPWEDPNKRNLVAEVSCKQPHIYGDPSWPKLILAVDCGMKLNQLRHFLRRKVRVKVVPWNHDLLSEKGYDGLYISSGPGDPVLLDALCQQIKKLTQVPNPIPIFGICLGHQLFGIVAGGRTYKMKFGHRGQNQPCVDSISKRCHLTMQNHGYAVDTSSITDNEWQVLFTNANDGTNEGLYHNSKPFFSVQFHPEHRGGPRDTTYLFDKFIAMIHAPSAREACEVMKNFDHPLNRTSVDSIKEIAPKVSKVLILGSGALSIGQAGEFDYSGSLAIKALKEEGITTVLINPNVATVQTTTGLADKIYFLPVTPEFVTRVIDNERPDAILVTFGGQTALNCGIELYHRGIFQKYNCRPLGTPMESIIATEDREIFAKKMEEIGERIAPSFAARSLDKAKQVALQIGYPVIVRAGFALGGLGSGFANNESELVTIVTKALSMSEQVLVEKSLKGWKEIEYEVVRDAYDNCITVTNMENFDPLGIHTGESIVVAPSQTLTDQEYHMLRSVAIKVIRHLKIVGECNIQYALNPYSKEYCIIEVNARLSRSSALASKATGYPLAFVAAKLVLGMSLDSLRNSVTKVTTACFEPSLDYVVVKIPVWDMQKFEHVKTKIGSAMKSVGEVMALGRSFEEALQKAMRMWNPGVDGFAPYVHPSSEEELEFPSDKRLFVLASAFKDKMPVDKVYELTKIDKWFLHKLNGIINLENTVSHYNDSNSIPRDLMLELKQKGFSDRQIARIVDSTEGAIRNKRIEYGITPYVKQIDTVSAEVSAQHTNYLYMTYNAVEDDIDFKEHGFMVIGSGGYRIGSSVEFDWCAVSAINTVKKLGHKTIMMNYNPETVSTDYDVCDRLYFEELSLERVLDVYEKENASGVILSMGGQIPNNLAMPLSRNYVKILGTSPEMIDAAENRYKFSRLLDTIGVDQPRWKEMSTIQDIESFCNEVGFPVLVRPSYVLSGAAMNVVYSLEALHSYISQAVAVSREHPVVVSKFIEYAKEIEIDAVGDNGTLVMHCISEHVENAGVHSGDATLVFPAQDLDRQTIEKVEEATRKIVKALHVTGPCNIQFLAKDNQIKVIECNLRASRSFPFVSKTLQYNLIEMATRIIMAPVNTTTASTVATNSTSTTSTPTTATTMTATTGVPAVEPYPVSIASINYVGVKVAQFSFSRLQGADPVLGVEMTSTGEVGCFGLNKHEAFLKALLSTGFKVPKKNIYLSIGAYKEKLEFFPFAQKLVSMGFSLFASPGTADFYRTYDDSNPLPITSLDWPGEAPGEGAVEKYLSNNNIHLCIICPSKTNTTPRRGSSNSNNTTTSNNNNTSTPMKATSNNSVNFTRGYLVRRSALDFNVPLITNIKFAKMLVDGLMLYRTPSQNLPIGRHDQRDSRRMVIIPGLIDMHVHVREPGQTHKEDWDTCSAAALSGGFTVIGAMPNTLPAITDWESFTLVNQLAAQKARCDYGIYMGASSTNAASLIKCFNSSTPPPSSHPLPPPLALKMYLDETFTTLRLNNLSTWMEHFKAWPRDYPICCHAEGANLAAVILLASLHDRSVHLCHVSRKDEIEVIKAAKEKGIKVTCEVTPHHLFLDEKEMGASIGPKRSRVCPKLNTEEDRRALWENIKVIDCIATDHAPHLAQEKDSETPPPGFPGLETVLALLLTAVHEGKLTLADIVDKCHTNPRKIFNLPEQPNTYVEVSLDEEWKIPAKLPYSRCGWTPFEGRAVKGRVSRVVVRGEIAYIDGKVLAPCGSGKNVREQASPLGVLPIEPSITANPPMPSTPQLFASPTKSKTPREASAIPGSPIASSPALIPPSPILQPPTTGTPSSIVDVTKQPMIDITHPPTAIPPTWAEHAVDQQQYGVLTAAHSFLGRSILSVKQFTREDVHQLFNTANEMKLIQRRTSGMSLLKGKVLANLFYEPSTRTACSFAAAMNRLGGSVISVNEAHSSIQKGESLVDTIKTLECYADVIVLRHPQANSVQLAAKHARVPVINAGDGIGEHPTQALLDVFTIREELGTVNGLTVTLLGDLRHGRTVHSLVQLLSLYKINQLHYVSPGSLKMPREIVEELNRKGVKQSEHSSVEEVIAETDVLYVTRIQKERFADIKEYQAVESSYIVTPKTLKNAKQRMVVMHPLPRVNEISTEVDSDPRAAYFRQMENGMYVRMALFAHVLGKGYS